MLSESRPIRKAIGKRSPKLFKVSYVDVHVILSSITQYIQHKSDAVLGPFPKLSFFVSCYLLNYWDFP